MTGEMEKLKEAQAEQLEKERATYRGLAEEVKRLKDLLKNQSGDREKVAEQLEEAVMEIKDLKRKNAEAEITTRRKLDTHSKLQKDLKEQVMQLERAADEQQKDAERQLHNLGRDTGSLEEALRAKERACEALTADVERMKETLQDEMDRADARQQQYLREAEEASAREEGYRVSMSTLQANHESEKRRISETMSLLIAEKDRVARETLAAQLSEKQAKGDVDALRIQVDGLEEQLAEARAEIQAQHERSMALEDNSLSASAQLVELQNSLTTRGSDMAKLQADNIATAERLQQAHDDVRGLQIRLRQVEEDRDRQRASAEQLEKECGDLQQRIAEKEAANANASMSVQDANSKAEQLHQRLTELSSERAVLQERLEAAEYRIAQLKAEKDAKEVEATKAQRDKQKMAVDHAQEMEELRRQVAQEIAEAARKADAEHHAALLEEQKKRQRALEDAYNGVNSDPRILRAADLEAKNAELLRHVKSIQDDTQNKLAESAREIHDLKTQLEQSRRTSEELRRQEESLRDALANKEDNMGDAASRLSRIHADYGHFVQSSETWLRELMQKVATLTAQRLHGDYLLGHKHREEVYELRGQLRQTRLALEQINEDYKEETQKREAAEVALENEQKINKELLERQTQGSASDLGLSRSEVKTLTNRRDPNSRSFGNRDIFISPERNAIQTSRGTLSQLAQDQEAITADANEQLNGEGLRANRVLLDDDRFVLESREELVSCLCKQDLRCDAAMEDATELYRMWRAAMTTTDLLSRGVSVASDVATSPARGNNGGGGGEGMVQTPRQNPNPNNASSSSPNGRPMPVGTVRFRSDVEVDSFTEKVVDVIEVTQSVCAAQADLIRSLLTDREKTLVKFNKASVA